MGQMLQTESETYDMGPAARSRRNLSFSNTTVYLGTMVLGDAAPHRKARNMRKRYCDWERVFEHIYQHCDHDGIWNGNDETLAAEFHVTPDAAYDVLSELCGRGLIEMPVPGTFAITKWPERDDPGEEELER